MLRCLVVRLRNEVNWLKMSVWWFLVWSLIICLSSMLSLCELIFVFVGLISLGVRLSMCINVSEWNMMKWL